MAESMRGVMSGYFDKLFSKCSEEEIETIIKELEILKNIVGDIAQPLEH